MSDEPETYEARAQEPANLEPATVESLRQTPLAEVHRELGARMIGFAGWDMPVWYESATVEHHGVRNQAGLFDLSHMAEIFVDGPDAAAFLSWALLVDATAMPSGRARYTMMCNDSGGIVDDLIVYRLEDHRFLVVANASNGATVMHELQARSEGFVVKLTDETDAWGLIALQGPEAERIVASVAGSGLVDLRYYRVAQLEILGAPGLAARTGYTGEDGFELFVPADLAIELWSQMAAAGASSGLIPAGLACRDTLRLEAGMPLYGNELTSQTTPFDVGSSRLFKVKPSGQFGEAALVKASAAAHDQLIGLRIHGRRPARTGYAVNVEGGQIGTITSGSPSPTLACLLAIARVSEPLEVGATVQVDIRDTMTVADVVALPFYQRSRI